MDLLLVVYLLKPLVFGSGNIMDCFYDLFYSFGAGVGFGFGFWTLLSLLGYGINKALSLISHG